MRTEKSKWRTHEDERTEPLHKGGITVVAMKSPRKGWSEGVMLQSRTRRVNQQWEEPMSEARPHDVTTRRVTTTAGAVKTWGGRWDLNPRHSEPQSDALPAELLPP